MKFGVHVSIAGGIPKAPARAHELGCECFQLFTRSPRGGPPPKLDKHTVSEFLEECDKYNFKHYYVHTPYYINFASTDKKIRKATIAIIREDLVRANTLGVRYVMTHLGSKKDLNDDTTAVEMVAEGIREATKGLSIETVLLLENAAGQGNSIGSSFDELAQILKKADLKELGICLDTAHMFAAGYDIRTEAALDKSLNEFKKKIGIRKLMLIHGNDSKVGLGERKDRHEHIGQGKIGTKGFRAVVNHKSLRNVDLIAETPLEGAKDDIKNLKKLKSLR